MAHVLLNWTNPALDEATVVTEQYIERKLPTEEWAKLDGALINEASGAYSCEDSAIPAPAEAEVVIEYRIVSVTAEGNVNGNVISVTVPKAAADPAVADLTGEYVA